MSRGRRKGWQLVLGAVLLVASAGALHADERDAISISRNIQRLHLPYGTILDPVFASSDPASPRYRNLVSYARAGDSAIWTGHYLAAEAFRYKVTRSSEALTNVRRAVRGIRRLLDVTGTGLLARCAVPADSPYLAAIRQAESGHGLYSRVLGTRSWVWLGNTSRDQYSGVMFGLSVAYEMVNVSTVRGFIRRDVTRILNYLLRHRWNVVMPDGRISTTFLHRPDQQLAFLQIGRQVDPQQFGPTYERYRGMLASWVSFGIAVDNLDDHSSYFKFNLNYINLYSLIRLEARSSPYLGVYLRAYDSLRARTEEHRNAHFNTIDLALKGRHGARDAETASALEVWLERPRRDHWVDLRNRYAACGTNRACRTIPLDERYNTDFLWQRSPFQLSGGGAGTIETAGIDYILSYWMGRHYGVPV